MVAAGGGGSGAGYGLVGLEGKGQLWISICLFLLQGTTEPWAKLIARAVSLEGLNNI